MKQVGVVRDSEGVMNKESGDSAGEEVTGAGKV